MGTAETVGTVVGSTRMGSQIGLSGWDEPTPERRGVTTATPVLRPPEQDGDDAIEADEGEGEMETWRGERTSAVAAGDMALSHFVVSVRERDRRSGGWYDIL